MERPRGNRNTPAARINARLMDAIQRRLVQDPEVDIPTLMSDNYRRQIEEARNLPPHRRRTRQVYYEFDIRTRLRTEDVAEFVQGPTPELRELLPEGDLSELVMRLLENEEEEEEEETWRQNKRIYKCKVAPFLRSVFRVSRTMVCKFNTLDLATDEFQALRYIKEHLDFPAPRAHGVVHFGCFGLLFTELMPGQTLDSVWPDLTPTQKQSLSSQVDGLFQRLRTQLPFPADGSISMGALGGGGCRDYRRGDNQRGQGIQTVEDFDAWVVSGASWGKSSQAFYQGVFADHQEKERQQQAPRIVFTHGDVHMDNLLVEQVNDNWTISAVLDWESAGFYPDYWEATLMEAYPKGRVGQSDWSRYLPASISPRRYASRWMLNKHWGVNMCPY